MTVERDDWRRMGQERFLVSGTAFVRKTYRAHRDDWEHDDCVMCTRKFMDPDPGRESAATVARDPDVLTEGYTTTEDYARGAEYEWVCPECFDDVAREFGWIDGAA